MSPVPKKIERGDSLVSPGMVCYAEKQVKPFWFSSLDQIVQFDTIIFCRTFKNYFGQFVWIEKKKKRKVTIIVAFHFMKRRLKTSCRFSTSVKYNTQLGGCTIFFQHAMMRQVEVRRIINLPGLDLLQVSKVNEFLNKS